MSVVGLAPRRFVAAIAARYVAGEDLASAIEVARGLRDRGLLATLDVLGEAVASEEEADGYVTMYLDALAALVDAGLEPHVSLKPTAFGIDPGGVATGRRIRVVVDRAGEVGGLVNIDMEASDTTDGTLALYRSLREEGRANIAVVLQACLRRTLADVAALAPLAPHVRICKGIYPEPDAIAHVAAEAIRTAYLAALDRLLEAGGYAAIATHDEALVTGALALLRRHGRGPDSYEFQTLLGVRQALAERLVHDGHAVRVYVPYGEHWYRYSIRRLHESPRLAGHVARDVLARALRRR